jgi:hypothetical protein
MSITFTPDAPGRVTVTVAITDGESDSVEVLCTDDPAHPAPIS